MPVQIDNFIAVVAGGQMRVEMTEREILNRADLILHQRFMKCAPDLVRRAIHDECDVYIKLQTDRTPAGFYTRSYGDEEPRFLGHNPEALILWQAMSVLIKEAQEVR